MGEASGVVVYRRDGYRRGLTAFFWAVVAVMSAFMVWAVRDGLEALIFLPLVVVFVVEAVTWRRQGLWVDDEGVTARAGFFTRRLAWADIEEIEAPPRYTHEHDRGIGLRRHDGAVFDVPLFSGSGGNVAVIVAELRRRHAVATGTPAVDLDRRPDPDYG